MWSTIFIDWKYSYIILLWKLCFGIFILFEYVLLHASIVLEVFFYITIWNLYFGYDVFFFCGWGETGLFYWWIVCILCLNCTRNAMRKKWEIQICAKLVNRMKVLFCKIQINVRLKSKNQNTEATFNAENNIWNVLNYLMSVFNRLCQVLQAFSLSILQENLSVHSFCQ